MSKPRVVTDRWEKRPLPQSFIWLFHRGDLDLMVWDCNSLGTDAGWFWQVTREGLVQRMGSKTSRRSAQRAATLAAKEVLSC